MLARDRDTVVHTLVYFSWKQKKLLGWLSLFLQLLWGRPSAGTDTSAFHLELILLHVIKLVDGIHCPFESGFILVVAIRWMRELTAR